MSGFIEGMAAIFKSFLYVATGMAVFGSLIITPTPQPTPTPTPIAIVSPITDPRLQYVQRKLVDDGFSETQVNQILQDPRRELYPAKVVSYKPVNWVPIKQKIYAPAFVQRGKEFLVANQVAFDQAEKEFNVPKEVIVGIIGIETEFGKNTGSTPAFNAIYSRLQQRPVGNWSLEAERLYALSKYCLEDNFDCYTLKGSYAGALGIVQFMPDSLQRYGIDGDKNGIIDLHNPVDAIPSAANFLKAHGYTNSPRTAITRYYGNPVGYPEIVLNYAELLKK